MEESDDTNGETGFSSVARRFGRRAPAIMSAFSIFALTGAALAPMNDGASRASRPKGFSVADSPARSLANGFFVSLGGLRTLAADAFWLRAYTVWEKRDRGACAAHALIACAMEPESETFRIGYASWLAFEFPHWTVNLLGGDRLVPQARRDEIHHADARAAIRMLEEEFARDPECFRYLAKASDIALVKLKDRELSGSYLKKAAESPLSPVIPALKYANALIEAGRAKEGLAWLSRHAERFPARSAEREFIADWISRRKSVE